MPLVVATLQANLNQIFETMNNIKDDSGNKYMAEGVASAISNFIKTGLVNSIDNGTAGDGGVYSGAGVGTMQINESNLKSKLQNTFEAEYENDDLASHIADDINSICSISNTISTTTTGLSVLGPKTNPTSGAGKGTFSGSKNIISNKLKACFSSMNNMSEGGNSYFALELATAINTYLTSGNINIILQAPMSGSGVGSIK